MIGEVLVAYFEKEGWSATHIKNGLEGLKEWQDNYYDCLILDLMLPDESGESICETIRKTSDKPILMLTAKSEEDHLLHGFSIGADDYIRKPFSTKEVVARVKALLKRSGKYEKQDHVLFDDGALMINDDAKKVTLNSETLSLTPNEYILLRTLSKHQGRVYSREDLLTVLMGENDYFEGYERNVDTHIKNLRKKLKDDPKTPRYIHTVFGMGYKFEVSSLD